MIHIHCWLTHNIQADWSHVVARLATSDPTTLVLHFPPRAQVQGGADMRAFQASLCLCVLATCWAAGAISFHTGGPDALLD